MDIVKWLRDERYDVCDRNMRCNGEVMEEAADEIERLREDKTELVEVLKFYACDCQCLDGCSIDDCGDVARKAIAKATGDE